MIHKFSTKRDKTAPIFVIFLTLSFNSVTNTSFAWNDETVTLNENNSEKICTNAKFVFHTECGPIANTFFWEEVETEGLGSSREQSSNPTYTSSEGTNSSQPSTSQNQNNDSLYPQDMGGGWGSPYRDFEMDELTSEFNSRRYTFIHSILWRSLRNHAPFLRYYFGDALILLADPDNYELLRSELSGINSPLEWLFQVVDRISWRMVFWTDRHLAAFIGSIGALIVLWVSRRNYLDHTVGLNFGSIPQPFLNHPLMRMFTRRNHATLRQFNNNINSTEHRTGRINLMAYFTQHVTTQIAGSNLRFVDRLIGSNVSSSGDVDRVLTGLRRMRRSFRRVINALQRFRR